jgi:hypothetical protein
MDTMRVESAETRLRRCEEQIALWRNEYDRQVEREAALQQQIGQLNEDRRRLAERQAATEQRIGQLAQLNAALLQLHEAETSGDVLTVIKEIVANLIGSESMGIYTKLPSGSLELLDGIGEDAAHTGRVGDAVVSIPLRLAERCVGVIAIFRLLPQKAGLEPSDHELFALLSTHAALALHNAGLRAAYATFA